MLLSKVTPLLFKGSIQKTQNVTDVTHQLKYLTLNVFMTNSCFEWNCNTLTLNSIEVKEVNVLHFGAPTNPSPICNAEFFLLLSAPFSTVSVFPSLFRAKNYRQPFFVFFSTKRSLQLSSQNPLQQFFRWQSQLLASNVSTTQKQLLQPFAFFHLYPCCTEESARRKTKLNKFVFWNTFFVLILILPFRVAQPL